MNGNASEKDNRDKQLPSPGSMMPDSRKFLKRWGALPLIVAVFVIPWVFSFFRALGETGQVSYSGFLQQLEQGNVRIVRIKGEQIQGEFRNPIAMGGQDGQRITEFQTFYPSQVGESLLGRLQEEQRRLQTDLARIEKEARESYGMAREDEIVFKMR